MQDSLTEFNALTALIGGFAVSACSNMCYLSKYLPPHHFGQFQLWWVYTRFPTWPRLSLSYGAYGSFWRLIGGTKLSGGFHFTFDLDTTTFSWVLFLQKYKGLLIIGYNLRRQIGQIPLVTKLQSSSNRVPPSCTDLNSRDLYLSRRGESMLFPI